MKKIFTHYSKLLLLSFLLLSSNFLRSQNFIEIVTDTVNFQYNSNGQWVNAELGTPQANQITSVQTQIGLDQLNMIWGGTGVNTSLRNLFNLDNTVCIDSARFWIQGDDRVTDLSLNGTTIGSTAFGWTNFLTALIPVNLFLPGQNTLTISGDNSSGARKFLAMKLRIYLCSCSNPIANEITTDTTNWQYESNGQWLNAELGTPQPNQIASVQSQIGLHPQNMIWGGNGVTTSLRYIFSIADTACIDSARFWIQGDDNVSDLSLNGDTIGSTPFGWDNFQTDLIPRSLFSAGQNTITLSGENYSGAKRFVAMKMVIYTCGCSISTSISDVSGNYNFQIWPNPANNMLNIYSNDLQIEQVRIYSLTGVLIMQDELMRNQLDISSLANGTYIAEIKTKETTVIRRWVKM